MTRSARILPCLFFAATAAACSSTQATGRDSGSLAPGATAPALTATAHDGTTIDVDAENQTLLVYFYPKDATPGCTTEACAFRDAWARYEAADIQVVGVSADSLESHRAFADKHDLPFPLVADEDLTWAKAFGVPTRLGMTQRMSVLVRDGQIVKVYPDVDPGVHAQEVLGDVPPR